MKSTDLFIKCLEHEGIQFIFGMAGEENLDLLESLRKSSIRYIPIRHEQAAGFMAATIGRLTGKVGVCLSTLGPGATNFVTPAAYAKLGGMPMLMITGQKPIHHNPQGNFQIVDIVNMFRPLTEMTTSLFSGRKIPAVIRESIRTAEEERPGPVHIELPKDVAIEDVGADHDQPFIVDKIRRPIAESKAVTKAIEMIQKAKSPLILIGAGANRKRTGKMLTEFIQKTNIPFVNTQMGKGVVDERNEAFIGTCALTKGDFVHKAIESSDLIINVGHDIIEKSPFLMKKDSKFKVIHINFFGAQVHEYYHPQLEVIGDIANAIWQIKEGITVQKSWDFSEAMKVKEEIEEKVYKEATSFWPLASRSKQLAASSSVKPQHLVGVVREVMPDDGIACLDNGMFKLWFARYYKAYAENTLLLDNALATMGAGLPSAIATKLLYPDRKVLAVAGDGGFMMNSQELETAVRLNLDLTVLIINDRGLGMIKWEQDHKGFNSFGLDHNNPDFVKYAESYGANGRRAMSSEQLKSALEESLSSKGVHVVECLVDYSENEKVFKI